MCKKSKMPSSAGKKDEQKRMESGGNIFRRLIQRQIAEDCSSGNDNDPGHTPRRSLESRVNAPLEGMASSSGVEGDTLMSSGEYVRDHSALLSLQPWIFRKDNAHVGEEEMKVNDEFSDKLRYEMDGFGDASLVNVSPWGVSLAYGCGRGRSTLRSRRSRRYSVKPLTSIETCLIPQLYNENFEIEESVFNSLPSPTAQAAKPFVITDGNRIISKSSHEPLGDNGLHQDVGVSSGVMGTVVGVSPLPELKKLKRKSRETHHGRMDSSNSKSSCKFSHSKEPFDGMLVFCLGVSIGVISTIMSNRKEVEKLNDLLKHTENLVQNLQEELEMKESLAVNQLVNEACGSHGHHYGNAKTEDLIESSKEQVPTSNFPAKETGEYNKLRLFNIESMSKIEAELEAELEKLELNMTANSVDGTISAPGKIDQDLIIANAVHGELQADSLDGEPHNRKDYNDRDSTSTSTAEPHDTNYAVSPRELSLRLHEVIKLRLEEKIKELERSLQQGQKQLQLMEIDGFLSQVTFSSSDLVSSTQESPTMMGMENLPSQAFCCLNLSGDALSAYDETYEELMQMTNTEENVSLTTSTTEKNFYGDGSYSSDQCLVWGMEGRSTDNLPRCAQFFEKEPIWEQITKRKESNDANGSNGDNEDKSDDDDDGDDFDDELIRQIVERTRQGSPVVLHAQRMLFSCDE